MRNALVISQVLSHLPNVSLVHALEIRDALVIGKGCEIFLCKLLQGFARRAAQRIARLALLKLPRCEMSSTAFLAVLWLFNWLLTFDVVFVGHRL